jgi:hypothetical protein
MPQIARTTALFRESSPNGPYQTFSDPKEAGRLRWAPTESIRLAERPDARRCTDRQNAPIITFAGNRGRYTVSDTIDIECGASDALSGILTASCPSIHAPAFMLAPGDHTVAGTATDCAGNVGAASVSFTIVVTPESIKQSVAQFLAKGDIGKRRFTYALFRKLGMPAWTGSSRRRPTPTRSTPRRLPRKRTDTAREPPSTTRCSSITSW